MKGNYKSQKQIDAAAKCREHAYYFVISKDGVVMSIQDPMCRRLVRVGRICINSLAKVAKDGIVIEEIHPKIDYDSRVETLLHNKCDAVCKQHRMNDGIVREVILCHSK